MNTKTKILAALSDRQAHTLTELYNLTKTHKVPTRISELREKGYDIKNKVEYRKGKFFRSTYQLAKLQTIHPISA